MAGLTVRFVVTRCEAISFVAAPATLRSAIGAGTSGAEQSQGFRLLLMRSIEGSILGIACSNLGLLRSELRAKVQAFVRSDAQ